MLIQETGQGVTNSNSYISVDDADIYHSLYNNLDWVGEDADKETALILASKSINLLYGPKFLSFKRLYGNLLFPRYVFYDNNQELIMDTTIPQCLKDAVCEVALMYINGTDIFPSTNTEGQLTANKIKIGEIEIEKQYSGKQGNVPNYSDFNMIDMILYPILKQKSTNMSFTL